MDIEEFKREMLACKKISKRIMRVENLDLYREKISREEPTTEEMLKELHELPKIMSNVMLQQVKVYCRELEKVHQESFWRERLIKIRMFLGNWFLTLRGARFYKF